MKDNWAEYDRLNQEFNRVCRRLKRGRERLTLIHDSTDTGGLKYEDILETLRATSQSLCVGSA